MGKLKKNQPGYTQAKDKNGRTIWVPDGSQAPNAGKVDTSASSAVSDFSAHDLDPYDLERKEATQAVMGAFSQYGISESNEEQYKGVIVPLPSEIAREVSDEYVDEVQDEVERDEPVPDDERMTISEVASEAASYVSVRFDKGDYFTRESNRYSLKRTCKAWDFDDKDMRMDMPTKYLIEGDAGALDGIYYAKKIAGEDGVINSVDREGLIEETVLDSIYAARKDIEEITGKPYGYEETVTFEQHKAGYKPRHYNSMTIGDFINKDREKYINFDDGSVDVKQAVIDYKNS